MSRIRAITFDLWDTVFVDDSDEEERSRRGLPSKREARRQAVHRALQAAGPITLERVSAAYDEVDAAFNKAWKEQYVTWTVRERLGTLLHNLGRTLPEEELRRLVEFHERMELEIRPRLVPGIKAALEELHHRYRLGVISDAVFTPGWALKEILAAEALKDYFEVFVFSDELGRSKPAPEVFKHAQRQLRAKNEEMLHLGDREHNDIAGPLALGWKTVLVTAVKDRGSESTRADAICGDWAELEGILELLESNP